MTSDSIPYLRTHSFYGFLESLLSPEALVNAALRYDIRTLGLTDHRYLTGAVEFYEDCKSHNIKWISPIKISMV